MLFCIYLNFFVQNDYTVQYSELFKVVIIKMHAISKLKGALQHHSRNIENPFRPIIISNYYKTKP